MPTVLTDADLGLVAALALWVGCRVPKGGCSSKDFPGDFWLDSDNEVGPPDNGGVMSDGCDLGCKVAASIGADIDAIRLVLVVAALALRGEGVCVGPPYSMSSTADDTAAG